MIPICAVRLIFTRLIFRLLYLYYCEFIMPPKRQLEYKDEFLTVGFTSIRDRIGIIRPQCLQCLQVLSSESMKQNKLKRHLERVHPTYVGKSVNFWKDKEILVKRTRLDSPSGPAVSSEKATFASFEVSWLIARSKKPHTIAEDLVKPAAILMVKIMCGDAMATKLGEIPLSDNTVKRRIDLMSEDILAQLISEIKVAKNFVLQLDETTDIASDPQLMVFVRYKRSDDFVEEFLFCLPLETTTTGEDIFNKVDEFMKKNGLDWRNCSAVSTDGAPSMRGSRTGLLGRITRENPEVITVHCFLHRENLASQRLQPELHSVLNDAIQIVNFIKSRSLNSRIFRKLCQEMGSEHENLLYHSEVRWLSRGKILKRVVELKVEIEIFLQEKEHALAEKFKDYIWLARLSYLSDIFGHLNDLNTEMQGRSKTIVDTGESIFAFKKKLELWKNKLHRQQIASFSDLALFLENSNEISLADVQDVIAAHLTNLCVEMERYMPENVDLSKHSWVRSPFTADVNKIGEEIPGFQEELCALQSKRVQKENFETFSLTQFWARLKDHPILVREAEKSLLPFPTTYLCEQGFSILVVIKTKSRNRLDPQHDMRCALTTNFRPRIAELVANMSQHHGSKTKSTVVT